MDQHPILEKFSNPNFAQSQQDFMYAHEFNKLLGTGVTRAITINSRGNARDINNISSFQHLIPNLIDWNDVNKVNQMRFTSRDISNLMDQNIKYSIESGKQIEIPLKELLFFYDITNNLRKDSLFNSPSRIESLIPTLANIEEAQKSKNINLKFAAKYIASNETAYGGAQEQLQPEEKSEIEGALFGKDIMATNSKINVQSLANNFRQLLLDDSIASDSTKVFTHFGINRDYVSYWSGGQTTYDNKTTGEISLYQNTIIPSAADTANTYTSFFGLQEKKEKIVFKYDHLPIMQEIEKKRIDMLKSKADIFKILIDARVDFETAASMVNLSELKQGTQNGSGQE